MVIEYCNEKRTQCNDDVYIEDNVMTILGKRNLKYGDLTKNHAISGVLIISYDEKSGVLGIEVLHTCLWEYIRDIR